MLQIRKIRVLYQVSRFAFQVDAILFAIAPVFEVAQMQKDGGFASAWNEFTAPDRRGTNASVGFDRFDRFDRI